MAPIVSLYATMPNILCVNLGLPVTTVGEFIKHVKANPGKLKYGSSGIGATPHLTMALFAAIHGLNMVHVPYKSASQGYTDAISGEIQTFFFNLPGPLPFVKAGRLRAIAVTSAKCWPRKALIKRPGVVDVSIGLPIDSAGRDPEELMRQVEDWIESEMRRLDPEAYPQG